MTSVGRWLRTKSFISTWAVVALALSSLVMGIGLVVSVHFAQDQARASDDQTDCARRISNYIGAYDLDLSVAQASGLLRALPPATLPKAVLDRLPLTDAEAVSLAAEASIRLMEMRDVRQNAVTICAADPNFDPTTYHPPEEAP